MRFAVALALALSLALAGCGGSPTSPSSSGGSGGSGSVTFLWSASTGGAGSYSLTFNGQTYTGTGPYTAALNPGTYEMSGTYTGGTLILSFLTGTSGGVQSGSVRSLAGTVGVLQSCGVLYSGSTQAQSFRVQFVVTSNPNTSC